MNLTRADDVLATITVTFRPDITTIREQFAQLPADAVRIVVDNASPTSVLDELCELAQVHGLRLIENKDNVGLAAATNQGIRLAKELGCSSVLFLDQDTLPGQGGVTGLRRAYRDLRLAGARPGCIGPRMVDPATGLEHGFHKIKGWRWTREFPAPGANAPILCSNLNGSGTLIPMEVIDQLGGLDDGLFIDHVDTEWAFRVQDAGFALYGAPAIAFAHSMGNRTIRFWWLRWRLWPYRPPHRHRFLFRNAIVLMRRDYVPGVWKLWAAGKLLLTWVVHALFDRYRFAQTAAMFGGIRDGLVHQHNDPGDSRND